MTGLSETKCERNSARFASRCVLESPGTCSIRSSRSPRRKELATGLHFRRGDIGNRRGVGDSLQSAGKAADKLQGDSETLEVIKTSTKIRA
jgi:hypothetical protein